MDAPLHKVACIARDRAEREQARENLNQGALIRELLSGTDLDSFNGMQCYCVAAVLAR